VPVAAARLADVGAADADPRVALRGEQHVGEQLAVGLLDEGALGEDVVSLGEAAGERVADLLQLAEVEDPWRTGGVDPVGNVDPAHALGDQAGQLVLQLADLPAQLGARQPLVYLDPVKNSRHEQILSRLEGRGRNP
jgi:hypothetical protein